MQGSNRVGGPSGDKQLKLNGLLEEFDDLKRSIRVFKKYSSNDELIDSLRRDLVVSFAVTVEHVLKYIAFIAKTEFFENCPHSKDSIQFAFRRGWISDERIWRHLLEVRNLTVHVYSRSMSASFADKILSGGYYEELERLMDVLSHE
ncbi:nucleotidyltransferase substrate binding protein [Paenibacillus sp. M1]|uniref:Nucleotidyltransferase substrate binding protein n=1 Tax=Paenibacillus haidiansis TaxID=1574488 RepID=A0ABU7VU57_9BACL